MTLNADGSFTYDPNGQFEDLDPGQRINDGAVYTISDPSGLRAFGTLVVTVEGAFERQDGTDGNDVLTVRPRDLQVIQVFDGGPGIDSVDFSQILEDVAVDGAGEATGPGIRRLFFDAERVLGGFGNDTMTVVERGRQVVQQFDGGAGSDSVDFGGVSGGVVVRGHGLAVGSGIAPLAFDAERVAGSGQDDTLTVVARGRQVVQQFDGGGGDDSVDFSEVAGGVVVRGQGSAVGSGIAPLSFDAEKAVGSLDDDTLVVASRGRQVVQQFDGGDGIDTVTFSSIASSVAVGGQGLATGSDIAPLTFNGERVEGSAQDDTLTVVARGRQVVQQFDGGNGFDTVDFGGVSGGVVVRGQGSAVGSGIAPLGFDAERIEGSAQDDTLTVVARGRQVVQRFDGGDGVDSVDFSEAPGGVVVRGQGTAVGSGIAPLRFDAEMVVGSLDDDTLVVASRGRQVVREFDGGDGSDGVDFGGVSGGVLVRGQGTAVGNGIAPLRFDAERVEGSAQDDTLTVVARGRQVVREFDGGDGIDTVAIARAVAHVVNLSTGSVQSGDSIVRLSGVEAAMGNAGDDRLIGDRVGNQLVGAGGDDILRGRAGGDVIAGDENASEAVPASAAATGLGKSAGAEDAAFGDDRVIGGRGDDDLWGDSAQPSHCQLGGADRFVFRPGDGKDVVHDFEQGRDLVVLRGFTQAARADPEFRVGLQAEPPLDFDGLDIEEEAGNSIIRFDGNNSITLRGVVGLAETDFLFF
ncbi:hypothetical protein GE300_06710 [Rhodobacteraceae bacterium 2CG4]|uniref:Hemolysin type calcium-binding protein n=1 Tax=Halovulum marinum TaxID=2662447 RepID=A0A6L5YZH5_9RHOB|nr:hypothetical protein [Halovulum marinum]MSU89310.1 hypothetical protein [Halovulum marinum]